MTGDRQSSPLRSREPSDPMARAIREHYEAEALRPEVLDRLRLLADLPDRSSRRAGRDRWARRAAMGGILAAAAAVLVLALRPGGLPAHPSAQIIAEEIALNHRKDLAVEFTTSAYPELAGHMEKLDFVPADAGDDYRLIGARYCSIQGRIAAQLKLSDDTGGVHALYQTRWDDRYDRLLDGQSGAPRDIPSDRETEIRSGIRIDLDDVEVRLWRQGDLLFGLATSSP